MTEYHDFLQTKERRARSVAAVAFALGSGPDVTPVAVRVGAE